MSEGIRQILQAGISAPSGENSQPWLFSIDGNKVDIFNNAQRDTSVYNHNQRSHLVSHGCLIENIFIAAVALGHHARLELFPENANPKLISRFHFTAAEEQDESGLFPYIAQRCTNRKPYKKIPLLSEHRERIAQSITGIGEVKLKLTEDPVAIMRLAEVGALNEKIVFENRALHHFLFEHLTWTKSKDERNPGFYIDTLELPPPAHFLFRMFQSWPLVSFLNTIGFSTLIKKGNQNVYQAASAMGVLMTETKYDLDYINIGRALQRIWLTATKHGLAFQPLTGVLFFMQAIDGGASKRFSTEHIAQVQKHYKIVQKIFDVEHESVAIMFRMGYDGEPSARTSRFPLENFIVKN
ncbi:MAG: hypothetical protein A2679_00035 [Candidatus Sungbacteria bacterium RIFCSPHIGHO2_01_FULL_54_26]|uniref:Uncharacterized protein n=1 Tax=Candidatus Sungbacteria bacterium RIFCSPHIGHO2_02_FULL_53_17 TaxID=1802275 RepID=A0A1G2KVZ4_9BACT|nr:MAG: hypothetical protein A2679_00035 [Candidatus Sungbacteria bacterium RIFCSPHIGHO2_01_FULL_54_26]OHA03596.1 MAG: hypothetical protein A3C92_01245 [Candidatus Sungbacteria bacterium RIFCSPHIGHO2_02_FULL_53_17]